LLGYCLEQRAKDYLNETVCRRIVIDRYMDGRGDRRGCEVGEARCDLCEANPRGTKRQNQAESQAAAVDAVDAADAVDKRRRKLEQAQCAKEQEIKLIQRWKTEQTQYKLERVEQHLQRWVGVCAICMAVKGTREQHKWEEYPAASEEQVEAMRVSC
jgi:hypothetical protein